VRKLRIINDAWPNNATAGSYIKDEVPVFPGALDGFCPTTRAMLFRLNHEYVTSSLPDE
jgi:hypothetical protein